MFRRFMIVCWVLFAISAIVCVVGYIGYSYYEGEANIALTDTRASRSLAAKNEPNAEEQKTLTERFEDAWERAGKDDPDESARFTPPVGVKEIQKRAAGYAVVSLFGGLLAGVMLLWNIIWHTGHWIWMGREQE